MTGGSKPQRGGTKRMKTLKALALTSGIAMFLVVFGLVTAAAGGTHPDDFDAAATYKGKCTTCHGADAAKKFDATLPEADMVQAILKGKKPEKPPNMPAYGEKGITEDQAKALVAYMKSLKK